MNRLRFGTSWRHLAPLVMTMFSLMTPSHAASLDVSGIIDSIISGSRTVLLLAPLPKQVLVIVSSPNSKVLDAEAIVFEEPLPSLTDSTMRLTSPQLFIDKWHELPTTADSLAVLRDKDNRYLVIASTGNLYFFNLDSKKIKINDFSTYTSGGNPLPSGQEASHFNKEHIFLSSLKTRHIYALYTHAIDPGMGDQALVNQAKVHYLVTSAFTDSTPLPSSPDITKETYKYVCGGDGTVQFSTTGCTDQGSKQVNWQITAGYITESSYIFVDAGTQSVFIIPNTADASGNPSYQTIPFEAYWTKGSPAPPKKHATAQPKVHHTTTPLLSTTVIIIIAVVAFILIVIVVSLIAFCLYRKSAKPENPEAAESELPQEEPGAPEESNQLVVQNKVTNKGKKASKGSHKRRRHSKGATPVAASSAEEPAPPAHHATMLVYAIDQVELKNRKASKLSGKRRTSKGTPSKRRLSSGRLASPRGRRASALKPQSNLVQARTSGRVASPRRSALKPPSKVGRRVSAGKPASRRHSRG